MLYSNTLTRTICHLHIKLMFVPIRVQQARAVFPQGIQSLFPRTEHADAISCLRKPRGKESCQRARADDKKFCFHLRLTVVDFFQ